MQAKALLALAVALSALASASAGSDKTRSGIFEWNRDTTTKGGGERDATLMVLVPCGISILFSIFLYMRVASVKIRGNKGQTATPADEACYDELETCYSTIQRGAKAFLMAQYKVCFLFVAIFSIVILVLTSRVGKKGNPDETNIWQWKIGGLTVASFLVGSVTSIVSGYIGMMVAVFANARTAVSAVPDGPTGWKGAFNCAFRAGAVMGFSLCGLAIAILYGLCMIYRDTWTIIRDGERYIDYKLVFETVAGFGLGGSTIAMFGRVGGGIFTKAADVGADLSGKVIGLKGGKKLDEDSPYNPAVIADNVGDPVGDVAGMGSDLFGSLGEASCAAMLIGSSVVEITEVGWAALVYPLYISSIGALVCLVLHFLATDIMPVKKEADIETVLKIQLIGTSLLMTGVMYPVTVGFLPETMTIQGVPRPVTSDNVYGCVLFGLWAGCAIGFITEYFTSHTYRPVRDVAKSCETGAATGIIYGLALGYLSSVLPVALIAGAIYFCVKTTGMYGVAVGSIGMLSTLATCLTIDVYGPISDNAGGVAEMSEFPGSVRDKTDALDAAGNTTAAIGKGFAIGSAALVSLALIGAFITRASSSQPDRSMSLEASGVNLMSAVTFAFLVFGSNIPYWFSALTMKSVGEAANEMVKEVARQWAEIPGLTETASMTFEERAEMRAKGQELVKPDYDKCIAIATNASLKEMIPPAMLVIITPILVGSLFGVEATVGFLAGALASSVQLAISMSNTGGAWDNSKKYTEKGELNGWFAFNDGTGGLDIKAFNDAASRNYGDSALVVPGTGAASRSAAPASRSAPTPVNAPQNMYYPQGQYMPGFGYGVPAAMGAYPMTMPQQGFAGSYPGVMVAGGNFGNEKPIDDEHTKTPEFQKWLGEFKAAGKAPKYKDYLGYLAENDPARYVDIMQGDIPAETTDGRFVVYAGKKSAIHAATVVGDTVGDPFKDTSGPALNIVMKLMAIISVVFADFFMSINSGNGVFLAGNLVSLKA
jgi:inorganic pyrophosphatase